MPPLHAYVGQMQRISDPFTFSDKPELTWTVPEAGRPDLWDPRPTATPGYGAFGCMDIRGPAVANNHTMTAAGYGVFFYPGQLPAASISNFNLRYLGNDPDAKISAAVKSDSKLWTNSQHDNPGATVNDLLYNLRVAQADPDPLNAGPYAMRPIRRADGRLMLTYRYPGSDVVVEEELTPAHPHWNNFITRLQNVYSEIRNKFTGPSGDMHQRFLWEMSHRYVLDYKQFIPVGLPDEQPIKPRTEKSDDYTDDGSGDEDLDSHTAQGGPSAWGWIKDASSGAVTVNASAGEGRYTANVTHYYSDSGNNGDLSNEIVTIEEIWGTDNATDSRVEGQLIARHDGGAYSSGNYIAMAVGVVNQRFQYMKLTAGSLSTIESSGTGLYTPGSSPHTVKAVFPDDGDHEGWYEGTKYWDITTPDDVFTSNRGHGVRTTWAYASNQTKDDYSATDTASGGADVRKHLTQAYKRING